MCCHSQSHELELWQGREGDTVTTAAVTDQVEQPFDTESAALAVLEATTIPAIAQDGSKPLADDVVFGEERPPEPADAPAKKTKAQRLAELSGPITSDCRML